MIVRNALRTQLRDPLRRSLRAPPANGHPYSGGGAPDVIYRTITNGVLNKGMPAWGAQLGAERVQAITAFLLTIKNTNVSGGRAAQGTPES